MRPRKMKMISFRVTEAEEADLQHRARRRGLSISELLRRYGRDLDSARGVMDYTAYGPQPVTRTSSGVALEARDGRLVQRDG